MQVYHTKIADVKVIEPKVFYDERGFFLETFQEKRYQSLLNMDLCFVQDNYSHSKKSVLRGLHFQKNKPQGKLVRVTHGEVYDVAVDIRKNSPSFGQWESVILSAENRKQFWIPPGLAHGFVALSDYAELEYKCTDYYDPDDEACLSWDDLDIAIEWPVQTPILSAKDQRGISLKDL